MMLQGFRKDFHWNAACRIKSRAIEAEDFFCSVELFSAVLRGEERPIFFGIQKPVSIHATVNFFHSINKFRSTLFSAASHF